MFRINGLYFNDKIYLVSIKFEIFTADFYIIPEYSNLRVKLITLSLLWRVLYMTQVLILDKIGRHVTTLKLEFVWQTNLYSVDCQYVCWRYISNSRTTEVDLVLCTKCCGVYSMGQEKRSFTQEHWINLKNK